MDSFDNPLNRDVGTDIRGAKITWMSVNAFNKCNELQKQFFLDNFGKDCDLSVKKVIGLYEELEIRKLYEDTKSKLHHVILEGIQNIPTHIIPHNIFFTLLYNLHYNQVSA